MKNISIKNYLLAILFIFLAVFFIDNENFFGNIVKFNLSIKPGAEVGLKSNVDSISLPDNNSEFFSKNIEFSFENLFFLENKNKGKTSFYSSVSVSDFFGEKGLFPGENLKIKIGENIENLSSIGSDLEIGEKLNNFISIKNPILINNTENSEKYGKFSFSPKFLLHLPAGKKMTDYTGVLEIVIIEEYNQE